MKNIFLNKIFIIIIMCIAIVLSFMTNCFAVSYTFSDENNYFLPDLPFDTSEYPYFFILKHDRTLDDVNFVYYNIYFNNTPYIYSGGSWSSVTVPSKSYTVAYNFNNDNSYNSITEYSSSSSMGFRNSIYFTNHDICDKSGNVVFQGAPVTVEQVTIPAIQEATQIPQAMGETLKVVLPIGLAVFGIGLVIYLIRSLIYRSM